MKRATPRRSQLTQGELDWLLDGEHPNDFLYWLFCGRAEALWMTHEKWAVKEFARDNPGCRPWPWWNYSAPEPRRRLGGIGTPTHECLAVVPHFAYGLPATLWVSPSEHAYYNGTARDVHGELIEYYSERLGRLARPGDFEGVPIDPGDTPQFESEAAFLKRHGLLLPGEEQRLTSEDFEPELVEPEEPPAAAPQPPPRKVVQLRTVGDPE